MIKLIASDMDGTLLDEKRRLPQDFFEVINKLHERDIYFAIASGRSYIALEQFFREYHDKLDFICDNGAYVVHKGELISVNTLTPDMVKRFICAASEIPDLKLILCGKNGTYHKFHDSKFQNEIEKYYPNHKTVESLDGIDDTIFKIAICDTHGPQNNSYPILQKALGDELNIQISGSIWADVMNRGVSKGDALADIQRKLGISKAETMAFGDYYNDVSMLQNAEYSFVMANANEDMKKYGNYIAASNYENGVMKAVREYALGEKIGVLL